MIDVLRIDANDKPLSLSGTHVVYCMTSVRRARWNHALDHAIVLANEQTFRSLLWNAWHSGIGGPMIEFTPSCSKA